MKREERRGLDDFNATRTPTNNQKTVSGKQSAECYARRPAKQLLNSRPVSSSHPQVILTNHKSAEITKSQSNRNSSYPQYLEY